MGKGDKYMFTEMMASGSGGGGSAPLAYEQGTCYPNDYVKQVGNCVFIVGQGSGNRANTAYLRGYVSEGNVVVTYDGVSGGYTATYENGTLTIKMVNQSGYYLNPNLELYYEDV